METRKSLLLKSETVKFLVTFDLSSLPRDDYCELIELCLRFLGEASQAVGEYLPEAACLPPCSLDGKDVVLLQDRHVS